MRSDASESAMSPDTRLRKLPAANSAPAITIRTSRACSARFFSGGSGGFGAKSVDRRGARLR